MPCFIDLNPVPLHELHVVGEVPGLALDPLQVLHTDYLLY
jgi:hypothetical protein